MRSASCAAIKESSLLIRRFPTYAARVPRFCAALSVRLYNLVDYFLYSNTMLDGRAFALSAQAFTLAVNKTGVRDGKRIVKLHKICFQNWNDVHIFRDWASISF